MFFFLGLHWTEVSWQNARGKTSRSKSRKGETKKDKRKQHQDPLAPFSGGSAAGQKDKEVPWTATTPTTRLARLQDQGEASHRLPPPPDLPPPPAPIADTTGKIPSAAAAVNIPKKEQLEAIRKLLGEAASEDLMDQLQTAIDKAPQPQNANLTHGHIHRVTNAQKQMDKTKQVIKELDAQWAQFTTTFQERWEMESKAYLAKRQTAVDQLSKNKQKLVEAHEALRKAASSQATPPNSQEGILSENAAMEATAFPNMGLPGIQEISDGEDIKMDVPETAVPNRRTRPVHPHPVFPRRETSRTQFCPMPRRRNEDYYPCGPRG